MDTHDVSHEGQADKGHLAQGPPRTTDQRIAAFFAPPVPPQLDGQVSVLHLLRREIQDCLIGEVTPENQTLSRPERRRLFATAILLVAGVDLLAKFYEGTDNNGGTGRRFKAFATRFILKGFGNAAILSEVLWVGCRNPLLHSFGIHNELYNIIVVRRIGAAPQGKPEPVLSKSLDGKSYALSVEGLFEAFCRTVAEYRDLLRDNQDLRRKFDLMFPKYGQISVGAVTIEVTDSGFVMRPERDSQRS
ncbi:MAG: hypothetical protein IT177_11110 [Acidobacteria bacterium]|nr:hypothetical protein [Acidobacteriota bacterium]